MTWTKIGNRYYKVEGNIIYKATYQEQDDEYIICGEWTTDSFSEKTESDLDANSWQYKSEVESLIG